MSHDPNTLFAQHGLRCTRQRVEIFDALAATKTHPTAEELHRMVSAAMPGVSLATVYNALEAFCAAGLCRKIPMPEGGSRYDADLCEHPHVRTPDGVVRDVPEDVGRRLLDALPRDVLDEVERRMGVRIRAVRIELVGDNATSDRRAS